MFRIIFLITCIFLINTGLAQTDAPVSPNLGTSALLPKSPQAAELMKVNEVSVNTATGVPNISFVLYTATAGDQKIPISVQYNASGIRYDDVPSAVGLKWSLNAGGEVSRNINGRPDETGYFDNASKYTFNKLNALGIYSDSGQLELGDIYTNNSDASHDDYSYSYLSNSGYIFNRKGKWWDCNHPFTTSVSATNNATLLGFTIADPLGNKAVFGGAGINDNFREFTETSLSGNGYENPNVPPAGTTAFKLSKIQSYLGEEATFSYISYSYSTYKLTSQTYSKRKNSLGGNTYNCNCGNSSFNNSYVTNNYSTLLVNDIRTPNEIIQFYYSSDASYNVYQKKLDSIVVTGTDNNNFIKKICFRYGKYDLSGYLRLDKIYEMDRNGDSLLIASFHYIPGGSSGLNSLCRDIYNYFNGFSNPCLISTNSPQYASNYGYANRDINESITMGLLDTISYPTGGKTVFGYSSNRYNNIYGPGVKVDSIVYLNYNYSETGRVTYKYSNPQNGFSYNGYVNNISYNGDNDACPVTSITSEIDLGYPALGFFYGEVEMRHVDASTGNAQLVKEIYGYEPSGYTNYIPVLNQRIYFRNNNIYDTLKIEKHTYEEIDLDTLSVDWVKPGGSFTPQPMYTMYGSSGYYQATSSCNVLYSTVGAYGSIMPRTALLKQVETIEFDQKDANNVLRNIIRYRYNGYWQKASEITTNSDGKFDSTIYHYLYTTTTYPALQTVKDYNLYDMIDVANRYTNNDVALSQTRIHYTMQGNGLILPDSVMQKKLDNNEYMKQAVSLYDNNGNILEAVENGMYKSFIRDYNNNEIIAHIVNGRYSQCAYTSFETGQTGNWTLADPGRDNSTSLTGRKSYYLTNVYPITKTGMVATNKYIVSYWSRNGSYAVSGQIVKTITGKIINGWTYYEHTVIPGSATLTISGNGSIDELRLYPVTAQMSTSAYDPLIGITSQCDGRNAISYYEYDSFGRLQLLRDQDGNILKTWNYHYISK